MKVVTRTINTKSQKEFEDAIQQGASVLRTGGLVAFPSETVYGLGADATNPTAVIRIFEVKQRPKFDPIIVHLAALDWLERYVASIPPDAIRLAEKFWPGPLTLVLPKRPIIPDVVTAGLDTVAVRIPSHPVAHALITQAAIPIAAPSANRFGHISPTTAKAVAQELGSEVDLILDGGSTQHGIESTVVGFDSTVPRLYRPGPITVEELTTCLGRRIEISTSPINVPISPGQLPRHYAPVTPLQLVPSASGFVVPKGKKIGLLAFHETSNVSSYAAVEILSPHGDLKEAAANLFDALRRLDEAGLDLIVAEMVPAVGIGLAIMDRLQKAATFIRSDS